MKVIFDTDIGDDIDDIWALGVLLNCKEIDVSLITVCFSDIEYKANVLKRVLNTFKRSDIQVALGRDTNIKGNVSAHPDCLKGYDGERLSATEAMKNVIENAEETVTVLECGPSTNIADFSEKYPELKDKYRVIAMAGAYKKGYVNQDRPDAEFNVLMDIPSQNKAMANTIYTMLPLDVCRDIVIDGEDFAKIKKSVNKTAESILDFYDEWQNNYVGGALKFDNTVSSSILYDVVTVHFALYPEEYTVVTDKIIADYKGRTVSDKNGCKITVATQTNVEKIKNFVVEKLTSRSI